MSHEVSISDDGPLSESSWRFFNSLSTTLGKLDSKIVTQGLAEAFFRHAEAGSSTGFPALKHIRVEATKGAMKHLIPFLSPSPVRTLVLTISDYDDGVGETPNALLTLLQQSIDPFASMLREIQFSVAIELNPQPFVSSVVLNELTAFASKHDIALEAEFRYDSFHHADKMDVPPSTSSACDAADDTLRLGLARSARLRERDDAEGAEAPLDLVAPLKGEILWEKD